MSDIVFNPFDRQLAFLRSKSRIRGLFCAKRAGKSEVAYIDSIIKAESQPDYIDNGKDPYLMAIVAPTHGMLRRLVWPKFRAFAKPFHTHSDFNIASDTLHWATNNTIILGISAEKISRMEGLKLNHIHLTEVFQMKKDAFLESLARTADTQGSITLDGSLGHNIVNPKATWVHDMFKKNQFPDAEIFEWRTIDNPHFPKDEIARLKSALDPRTFRAMFEMDWDTMPDSAVYSELDDGNFMDDYRLNNAYETYIAIDWGWAHPMAVLFIQYDRHNDMVYVFDEIVESKLKLDALWIRIMSKIKSWGIARIHGWVADIAGNQEREQTGISNIRWFREKHNITIKYRTSSILKGIAIVRSYIKNGMGQSKMMIYESQCPKLTDSMKVYSYHERDGSVVNENPIKKNDDPPDALRYWFVNYLDDTYNRQLNIVIS